MFSRKFSRIFQNNHFIEHFRSVAFLICESLLAEWQLPNSFLGTYVFSEYFSLRAELLLNCVEKPLRWRLQTRLFLFFVLPSLKKKNLCFGRDLLLRKLLIPSINGFLENRDQNSLDTRPFSAIFHVVPEVDNCAHNYQTWAANRSNLKEFPYRTVSLKYSLFPFCVSESSNLKNSMHKTKSIKHFKSILMQFFTLFSRYFQCMTTKV